MRYPEPEPDWLCAASVLPTTQIFVQVVLAWSSVEESLDRPSRCHSIIEPEYGRLCTANRSTSETSAVRKAGGLKEKNKPFKWRMLLTSQSRLGVVELKASVPRSIPADAAH